MRYLVSPEFSAKLVALSPGDIQHISAFLQTVGTSDKTQLLEASGQKSSLLGKGVYVSKVGEMRLYFTFGGDADGEYVLLLDATTKQAKITSRELFATKNPKMNSALNPRFNTAINPRFNTSLNPRFNTSINPKFNTSLNPRFNTSINPRMNYAFGGPYLYGADLQQEGYLVRVNDEVELLFDLSSNHVGELVRVNENVRVQFDADNDWNGYLVRANDDVTLRYDLDGEWVGLVV